MKKTNRKGIYGSRVKIQPEKIDSMLQTEDSNFIQRGKVLGVGPYVTSIKVGDTLVFNSWGLDKAGTGDDISYYLMDSDEFILEII